MELMNGKNGIVYLVGAGPGDPGLLTLKGKNCLERAEVVVYDRLSAESLLEFAPEDAIRIDVGKEPGNHPIPQQEINRILFEHAKSGKRVVRLKGGDPFLFGRGGEEALALKKEGIPFEIVPGVTSAFAVPAYAGIPVTHRGVANRVTVLTGHEVGEKVSDEPDWGNLAGKGRTLVILMGVANLDSIINKLLEHGVSGQFPAAIIENGATSGQRLLKTSLQELNFKAKVANIKSPAVVIIGEVSNLAEKLDWFKPDQTLSGKKIIITRPDGQNLKLAELISCAGGEPLLYPTIKINHVLDIESDNMWNYFKKAGWLVFTSTNGVVGFFKGLKAKGLDTRFLNGLKIAAIGAATAGVLEERGITADLVPEHYTGADLCRKLGPLVAHEKVVLIRVYDAPRELADGLRNCGAEVKEYSVYRVETETGNVSKICNALQQKQVDAVTFTSPSTVKGFLENISFNVNYLSGVKVVCIGPVTAKYAKSQGIRVDAVSSNSGDLEMVAELKKILYSE